MAPRRRRTGVRSAVDILGKLSIAAQVVCGVERFAAAIEAVTSARDLTLEPAFGGPAALALDFFDTPSDHDSTPKADPMF
jgi:hypothetical protein